MATERTDERTGLVIVGSNAVAESEARGRLRATGDGRGLHLRRGVSMDVSEWKLLDARQRYISRIRAVVETRVHRPVISHRSAAALWGFPERAGWPLTVDVLARPGSAIRSKNGVIVHRCEFGENDLVELGGILVTSPERTLVDLARTARFVDAVIALDFAINPDRARSEILTSADILCERVERAANPHGQMKALRAIRFARIGAQNAGETQSRVVIFELGFPDPELQTEHANPRGGSYFTDFEWPWFRLIGELDGLDKYLKDEYLHGMTPGQAVMIEKTREDDLRAEGNGFARWGLPEVRQPHLLEAILRRAGLPRVR